MRQHSALIVCVFFVTHCFGPALDHSQAADVDAGGILRATGVQGGLIVHLGCGDGQLTAALHASDSFIVHGLERERGKLVQARAHVRSLGLGGKVPFALLRGNRLPYVDNLVNLVVAEDLVGVPMVEVMRVLCPNGVAYVKEGGQWRKTVKPWPKEIDEWTHYLHDATNNAVGHDTVVGPPKHLQWVGSPTWTRHHDHMSSLTAMVSARGRIFYIIDEGPRAEVQLPPKWMLVARDAFNGTVLWRRPLLNWHVHLWPLKSGPAQLPRRLVAVGDRVYVTLGLDAPLTALDAATGKTVHTYARTKRTEEILFADGVLFLLVNPKPTTRPWSTKPAYARYGDLASEPNAWAWDRGPRRILAVAADTGAVVWQAESPVAPLSLGIDAKRVLFHDGERVVCLSRSTGKRLWASKPVPSAEKMRSWSAPTLVVHDDVIVFAGGEKILRHKGGKDTMTALSAETGNVLWTAEHPPSGYDSPEDVFMVDGLVWTAPTTNKRDTGTVTGRDLHTGEVKCTFPADDGVHMPHHRCHRAKATDRYLVMSRTGIEYVDLRARHWDRNDWVRGACLYGVVPANGLTYAPQHSCACYIVAKLTGLNALAAERSKERGAGSEGGRLERGRAYAEVRGQKSEVREDDWPTYRCDVARSGRSASAVPANLKQAWQVELGGKLSAPVVAEGKVFVADVDAQVVHALDAATGREAWSFIAGGRVDSPPTIWQGRVLFGCRDGWVYCLRASDGALAWRYRAAPKEALVMAWEQVESAWPAHGSVLVHEGVVHCIAGRNMFLDGGLRYVRLDAATGRALSETALGRLHPGTEKPLDAEIKWPNLPVALPDVLSYDGQFVYMRSQRFGLEGKRIDVVAPKSYRDQKGEGAHLFCPTGFLDDSWWHRTYWLYGKSPMSAAGGWYLAAYQAPAGRIMVCDESRVYAFGRRPQYFPRTTALEYHLFAAKKEPEIVGRDGKPPKSLMTKRGRRRRPTPTRALYDWSRTVPVLGRALVLAGNTLFVAGPPDVVDQEETLTQLDGEETAHKLAAQSDAYAGKKGALLLAVSATGGERLAAYGLDSMPVFDGMAAANRRLYLATTDGKVLCLAGEGEPLKPGPQEPLEETPLNVVRGLKLTMSHPEFQHLSDVQITKCDLGRRVKTPSGGVGLALKKLKTPLTKQATFKLRLLMIPNPTKGPAHRAPGNAFLAFGDAPDDARLVKCGLRNAGQRIQIALGPLLTGKSAAKPAPTEVSKVINCAVTVDLTNQKVSMAMLGQTLEAELLRPLASIAYVGYAVNSVASEFGPVEIEGR